MARSPDEKDKEVRKNLAAISARSAKGHYEDSDLKYMIDAIKYLKVRHRLTLSALAAHCELSVSGLGSILSGRNNPRYYNFHRLLSGLIVLAKRRPGGRSVPVQKFNYQWPAIWIANPILENSHRLNELRGHLQHFVDVVRGVNNPESISITELEKAELIALLHTAIVLLGAPKIEKGLFQKISREAKELVFDSIRSESKVAIGTAARAAVNAIRHSLGI